MANQTHVALVNKLYAAFAAGETEAMIDLFADDAVLELPAMPGVPLSSRYEGHQGVRRFLADRAPALTYDSFAPHTFLSDQDIVVVLGETSGKVISTNAPFCYKWVQLFEFSPDNEIQRFHEFLDTQVLAAAFAG